MSSPMQQAYLKSLRIIKGCLTKEHLRTAEKFVNMFEKHFGRNYRYKELLKALREKEATIFKK